MKINKRLLPVKAHYFLFMAALGPMLPQLNVFGRQLGIAPEVMGLVTAVLPILFMIAKPVVGFLVDYFQNQRKLIFVGLIISMSLSLSILYFLPLPVAHLLDSVDSFNISTSSCPPDNCNDEHMTKEFLCTQSKPIVCELICESYNQTERHTILGLVFPKKVDIKHINDKTDLAICSSGNDTKMNCTGFSAENCYYECFPDETRAIDCLYGTFTFWVFVIFMSLGTIGFNVTNCIGDAICFDVLGEGGEMNYGKQRVWGTIGYGLTALIGGFAVDWYSDGEIKSYTPAILIMIVFTAFDLLTCIKLKLPIMHQSDNIIKDVWKLIKQKHITIFLCFAVMAGVMDSFIIYYMFWHIEEMATATGHFENIKLLEGLIIAAESFGGEVLFFIISGKILTKIGFCHSLTFCFVCYSIRFGLISIVTNPWWILPIELFMQGPTYALCYTTIVAYASAVAPKGASATMQGIVAGMDDGFGFTIGSLIGGFLYKWIGGTKSFQVFSVFALCCSVLHAILYVTLIRGTIGSQKPGDMEKKEPLTPRHVGDIVTRGHYDTPEVAIETKTDHAEPDC